MDTRTDLLFRKRHDSWFDKGRGQDSWGTRAGGAARKGVWWQIIIDFIYLVKQCGLS